MHLGRLWRAQNPRLRCLNRTATAASRTCQFSSFSVAWPRGGSLGALRPCSACMFLQLFLSADSACGALPAPSRAKDLGRGLLSSLGLVKLQICLARIMKLLCARCSENVLSCLRGCAEPALAGLCVCPATCPHDQQCTMVYCSGSAWCRLRPQIAAVKQDQTVAKVRTSRPAWEAARSRCAAVCPPLPSQGLQSSRAHPRLG